MIEFAEFAEFAEALRERGFGVTHTVRVADVGPNKIMVIKVVRELTGWGLADAKNAVDRRAGIVDGISLGEAEHAATKLRGAGATVELGVGELHLYAFDPADPRRGDQPIERIRVQGFGFAFERGRLGAWAPEPIEPREPDQLIATIDQHLHAWTRARKQHATTEIAVLERLSARERTLEDRLRSGDGEDRHREAAVYGDWLQAQGDPRGRIAAATLTAADAGEIDRLTFAHRSHVFGPSLPLIEPCKWTWLGPILDTLAIRHEKVEPAPSCERVAELLATPVCACLRSLVVDRPLARDAALGDVLAAAACAPGLRELRIKYITALTLRGDSFVRLENLALSGRLALGPITLPALRELYVNLEVPLVPLAASFVDMQAPALEHFTISVLAHDYWDQNYGPMQDNLCVLLSQPSFARLRTLTIVGGPLFVGFAGLLAKIPAIATLERIDLQNIHMNDDCRAELERHRDRLPGLLL